MPTDKDELIWGLMRGIARALVDNDQAVDVEVQDQNGSTTHNLRVASSDLGKTIGREGRTARSLRVILRSASMKFHR
jgi:uncharacterized protein